MTREQLLLELLSRKLKEEKKAKTAWEQRGPKDKWLVLLDELKRAETELNEVLDVIKEQY